MVFGLLRVPAPSTAEGLIDEMDRVVVQYRVVFNTYGPLRNLRLRMMNREFTSLRKAASGYRIEGPLLTRYTNIVNSFTAICVGIYDIDLLYNDMVSPLIDITY